MNERDMALTRKHIAPTEPAGNGVERFIPARHEPLLEAVRAAELEVDAGFACAGRGEDPRRARSDGHAGPSRDQVGVALVLEGDLAALRDAVVAASRQADAEMAPVGAGERA